MENVTLLELVIWEERFSCFMLPVPCFCYVYVDYWHLNPLSFKLLLKILSISSIELSLSINL